MSILIKGMEMPKDGCKDCLLVKRGQVFDICPFLKREVSGNVERGGKPLGCPLVPVPPHGRLFDADALMREMHNVILEDGEDRRIFYSVIERQPTIIPAEEE